MRQTVLTISLPVQTRSLDALRTCIKALWAGFQRPDETAADRYDQFGAAIPALHFASIMIFEDDHYDPLLTVELNFDGLARHFFPQLESAAIEPQMRSMIRCCKRPGGGAGAMYDAIIATDSKAPLAPFLERCATRPAIFHQGNRGLDRDRIVAEQALFRDAQVELEALKLECESDAVQIHERLREALVARHPWLLTAEPPRWTAVERLADFAALAGFGWIALLCLSVPGMVLALLMPTPIAILGCLMGALIVAMATPGLLATLRQSRATVEPVPGLPKVPANAAGLRAAWLSVGIVVLATFVALTALVFTLVLAPLRGDALRALYNASFGVVATGLLTVPLPIAIVLFWLRWLEDRDPTQDAPQSNAETLAAIAAQEDKTTAQNHMGSLVLIKPGLLRALLVRAGLWGLGFFLRATQSEGYLASMRTIHFAHWAILSDGGRLAFFSNFDSSWESYLDDFIEKAHAGLTLAWSNAVGFPRTLFLLGAGATAGRLFKAWARHSMAEGLFWFSAYKDLSVNQIERQCRIASGLRKRTLSPTEATTWACDL